MNAQLYTLRDVTRLPSGGWTKFLRSTGRLLLHEFAAYSRDSARWSARKRVRAGIVSAPALRLRNGTTSRM